MRRLPASNETEIEGDEPSRAENLQHRRSEEVEAQHVEEEVPDVGMDEARGDELVDLLIARDLVRALRRGADRAGSRPRDEAHQAGDENDARTATRASSSLPSPRPCRTRFGPVSGSQPPGCKADLPTDPRCLPKWNASVWRAATPLHCWGTSVMP